MCSGVGSRVLLDWVSPFGHPRITAWLPTPRGLSQAPTSFIGSWCQDIHRLPLVACHTTKNYKDARVHYTVLKIRAGTPTRPTTTHREHPTQGKNTPSGHPHQEFGEGWPQPHHHTNHHPQRGRSQYSK